MTDEWIQAKVNEIMKFIEKECNITADGMFRSERPRRQAAYIRMWNAIIEEVKNKAREIEILQKEEVRHDDNMVYWLNQWRAKE